MAMDRKHIVGGLVILAATCSGPPAFADGPRFPMGPGTKLARGVVNAATGWLEVPKQTAISTQEATFSNLIGGLFQGVLMGTARTLVGGYEITSFLVPAPEQYGPVTRPPTVFAGR
jgi:putative exosortase-associated protein (TIGR04073 family)